MIFKNVVVSESNELISALLGIQRRIRERETFSKTNLAIGTENRKQPLVFAPPARARVLHVAIISARLEEGETCALIIIIIIIVYGTHASRVANIVAVSPRPICAQLSSPSQMFRGPCTLVRRLPVRECVSRGTDSPSPPSRLCVTVRSRDRRCRCHFDASLFGVKDTI